MSRNGNDVDWKPDARHRLRYSKDSMSQIAEQEGFNSAGPVRRLNAEENIRVYFDPHNSRKWIVNRKMERANAPNDRKE